MASIGIWHIMSLDDVIASFHYLLPKLALTRFADFVANLEISWLKNRIIHRFIRKYQVNMAEAIEENPENYRSFNDFFIRQLKPEIRPLADTTVVSPVDGIISELGRIHRGSLIQAKGISYHLNQLLKDESMSQTFSQGCFITLYLSPKDYHRVHMPMDGEYIKSIYVPGSLFSVQPLTVRKIPRLFARNERLIVFFDTPVGPMAMILVGATGVGAIHSYWHGRLKRNHQLSQVPAAALNSDTIHRQKGAEMGYFELGSTVILLFADGNTIKWLPHLKAGDPVLFGGPLGEIVQNGLNCAIN